MSARTVLLTLVLFAPAALAQPARARLDSLPRYRFERLSVADGLPHDDARAPLQDRQGFLWFGTQNGLVRYDGREVKVFRQRSASGRVNLRKVEALLEDARGDIWAGGSGQSGLWRLDRRTERWTSYEHDPRRPVTLSSNLIREIVEVAPGWLLVLTASPDQRNMCLDRLDTRTGQVRRFRWRRDSPNAPEGRCMVVAVPFNSKKDARGGVWLSADVGLYRYDPRTDSVLAVTSAAVTPYGQARFSALDAALRSGRTLARIERPGNYTDRTAPFRLDRPTRVLVAGGGEMRQGSRFDYGWIEDARGDTVWVMRHEPSSWLGGDPTSRLVVASPRLPPGRYRLRFKTDFNQGPEEWLTSPPEREDLWGIHVVEPSSDALGSLAPLETRASPRRHDQLDTGSGLPLGDDGRGGLIAATFPGVWRRHHATGYLEELTAAAGPSGLPDSLQLKNAFAYSMHATPDGVLWLGTNQGLYRLRAGRAAHYSFDPEPLGPANFLTQIVPVRDGTFWMAAGNGVIHFDPATGRHQHYRLETSVPTAGIWGIRILQDRQGNVWVSVPMGGIYRLDRTSGRAVQVQHRAGDRTSLPSEAVRGLTETADGALWVVTDSGLVRFEPTVRRLRRIPGGQDRYMIARSDRVGQLWAVAMNVQAADRPPRLVRLDPSSGGVLQTQDLGGYWFDVLQDDPDGSIWIGGEDGLRRFDP
ncbi:MAG TPA: hypothetical protein VD948_05060, partial [Rhodothermales bacterium]|nr:hypothetical protein [Rhodothermales bacterium]